MANICCRLHEESSSDAVKVGELVKQLGVEHHIVNLDWEAEGGVPTKGKIQLAARNKRYAALLNLCEKMDIRTLMLAHNMDNQNGKLVQVQGIVYCHITYFPQKHFCCVWQRGVAFRGWEECTLSHYVQDSLLWKS